MTPSRDRALLVTSENAASLGQFSQYRKTATTRISDFTMPPGTTYQTPEGLRAEDEETRIAFDVQGGVYPIRESVFRDSYAALRTALGDSDGLRDDRLACAVLIHGSLGSGVLLPGTDYRVAEIRERWEPSPVVGGEPTVSTVVRFHPVKGDSDGLDAAWTEAEAALPGGRGLWLIQGVQLVDTSDSEDLSDEQLEWEAEAVDHQRGGQPRNITALGPTPAAALRALAERLGSPETQETE